jgi:hypothetical protein
MKLCASLLACVALASLRETACAADAEATPLGRGGTAAEVTAANEPRGFSRGTSVNDIAGIPGAAGGTVIIAGAFSGASGTYSVLRFANFGDVAGSARVAIVDPAQGRTIAAWQSPEVPGHGALQIDLAEVVEAAGETTAPALPAAVDLQISGTIRVSVQHLIGRSAGGALANASACGAAVIATRERIGLVPADTSGSRYAVRFVNSGAAAAKASVIIRNAATGKPIANWTSPPVAAGGSVTVAARTIRSEAGIDLNTGAIVIDTDRLDRGLRLELTATDSFDGSVSDQTASCRL